MILQIENVSTEVSGMKISRTDEQLPKFIRLKDEKCTVMKLRSTPKILRRHRMKMSHEQVYSKILLCLPFTNESKELATDPTNCLALYEGNKSILDDNMNE